MVAHNRIHHGSRLVVENALRLRGEGAGNCDGAAVAGGKIARIGIARLPDIHHLQQSLDDILFVLLVVVFAQFQRKQNILGHGEGIEQGPGLKNHRHFTPDAVHLGFAYP